LATPVAEAWRHTPRSVVIVDEASMVSRAQFLALLDLTNESGASVRLVGDPDQLGAVGRGGVMAEASHFTNPVILDTVHRFQRVVVHENPDGSTWSEQVADTSYARLMGLVRAGIAPEDTARRLVTGGYVQRHVDEDALLEAVAAEVVASWGTPMAAAVTVPTNATARRLSDHIRRGLVAQGVVTDQRVAFGREGERIGVGDRVTSRANDHTLGVVNRQVFTVEAVTSDGALRVRDAGDVVRTLSPAFVTANLELAYAVTGHGNQGVTAPIAHGVHGDTMDRAGLYVALSRGRLANTLHVVAEDDQDAQQQIAHTLATRYGDEGLAAATLIANADARATRAEPQFAVDDLRLLLHASGLSTDTVDAAMSSPALDVLRGALDDLTAAGVDVDVTVPALVTMRELGSAEDVTSVLHYRVATLLADLGPIAPAEDSDHDTAPVVAATRASVQRQLREEKARARLRRAVGTEPNEADVAAAIAESQARADLSTHEQAQTPTTERGPQLDR
ncbi:MAG: ATP-dependent DNA helicase, partial [Acidimicrobiales bacterium]